MKSLPFDMIALHMQAPEHTLQHCWGNCMHCCRNAFTQVLQIPLHLVHLRHDVTPWKVQDHASVLPTTVASLFQSSVLGTARWGNYAQCSQSAVGRRPVETPPNPECCRQTFGAAGIAQARPGTMLTWLSKKKKVLLGEAKKSKCAVGWGPALGCDRPFSSVRSARFVTQCTLGWHVPDWEDVLTLLNSALSPVIWSPQFPATSTTAQNVSRHKHSQFTGICWPNL